MRPALVATADVVFFALVFGAGIWFAARGFPIFDVSPWSNVIENTYFGTVGYIIGRFLRGKRIK